MWYESVPVFSNQLDNLKIILLKAQAADSQGRLLSERIHPTMFPLTFQVYLACTAATNFICNLQGRQHEVELFTEYSTYEELCSAIEVTRYWLECLTPSDMEGLDHKVIEVRVNRDKIKKTYDAKNAVAIDYLRHWVLPNFYFHVSTTYLILRHNGVSLGKRDYLHGNNRSVLAEPLN